MTHEDRRKRPEHHIVHDYANLVSSGLLITDRDWNDRLGSIAPVNSHVWHAFYINCRKLFEFFTYEPHIRYFRAKQFMIGDLPFTFCHWTSKVQGFMETHMMHVGAGRIDNEVVSTGHSDILYLGDFQNAWSAFLGNLKPGHKDIFRDEIEYRLVYPRSEFAHCGTLGKESIR